MTAVTLVPMSGADYPAFLRSAAETYADGAAQSGELSRTEALERALRDLDALLPESWATPSTLLRVVMVGDRRVGHVWVGVRSAGDLQYGWLWDLFVEPPERGNGYAVAAMRLVEQEARKTLGVTEVRLNVFASNRAVVRLYEALGYSTTSQVMRTVLD